MATQSIRARIAATVPLRPLQLALGVVVSGVALYFALRGVDWSAAVDALREARYPLLVPAVGVLLVALLFRATRWRLLFYPRTGLSLPHFFGVLNVGFMVNNIVPLQIGDLVRAYLVGQLEGLRKSRTFPTVVVERLVDILVLFGLLMVLMPFISVPLWASVPVAVAAGIVLVVALALVGVVGNRSLVFRLLDWALRFVPGRYHESLRGMTESALDGVAVLAMPRIFAGVVVWSVATWLATALVLYLVMLAFSLGVPFSAAIFVVVMTSLGFLVPSSPGALGVYHYISIRSLEGVFGVNHAEAVSYTVVAHLIFYLPPLVIGGFFLWREHLSWRQLRALVTDQADARDEADLVASVHDEAERPA